MNNVPVYVYKWEDVQIQHGVGDIYIDMTKAANIKENNTIVVRHILGKSTTDCSS